MTSSNSTIRLRREPAGARSKILLADGKKQIVEVEDYAVQLWREIAKAGPEEPLPPAFYAARFQRDVSPERELNEHVAIYNIDFRRIAITLAQIEEHGLSKCI